MADSQKLLDTHIHLWPSTATSPKDHGWMTDGHFLSRQHGISEYTHATAASRVHPSGFLYVETDRYLPTPAPDVSPRLLASGTAQEKAAELAKLRTWAKAPLDELAFLGRMLARDPAAGDGFVPSDAQLCKGLVVYLPFYLARPVFDEYVRLAVGALGEHAWRRRVVGYRCLLQGRGVREVRAWIEETDWVGNMRGVRGVAFDVGVDCHRDGVGGLDVVRSMVGRVNEKVEEEEGQKEMVFVLNHLCKPDMSSTTWSSFPAWKSSLAHFRNDKNVYMKLSGAFNEFSPGPTPPTVDAMLDDLRPFLDHVLEVFGPTRIMFGSDWPVCNVGGPKGEQGNWSFWRDVVEAWMGEKGLSDEEREWIWWRAGYAAYKLDEIEKGS